MRTRHAILSVGLAAALAGPAFAQSPTARNATVAPGKPARVAVVTALKRDCTIGEVGSIRIVAPPKNGTLVIRSAKAKTPASFRCPNVETPVQALFYQANAKFSGTDEIAYETRSPDGATQNYTVKITVSDKPAAPAGAPKTDVLEL
jgi:hypothetical protein